MKFTNKTHVVSKDNKVILANVENGKWIRLSQEVFEVIQHIMGHENSAEIEYENSSDKDYIASLFEELENAKLICENNTSSTKNKTVSIEITHRCNLHCIHCCVDADMDCETIDLSTEDLLEIIDKCIEWNPERIMLSGGEPLMRSDFLTLLKYLRNRFKGKVIVSTNALLINEKNINELCNNTDQIDISLDGVDEYTTSLVRGKGVFSKVLNKIELLHNNSFQNITLSMVVADKNASLEKRFIELNEKLGTLPIVRAFAESGRGKSSKNHFTSTGDDEVYIPEEYLQDDYSKIDSICTCSAGVNELFIDYKGNVYPCPSFIEERYQLGNVLQVHNISELVGTINIHKSTKEKIDKLYPDNKCKSCEVFLFCWTCPGAISRIHTKAAFKYQCEMIRPVLMKRIWGV